jgi:hypothetical protein
MHNTKYSSSDDECVGLVIDDILEFAKGGIVSNDFNNVVVDRINEIWDHGNVHTNLALRNLYSFAKAQRSFYVRQTPNGQDIILGIDDKTQQPV